MHTQHVTKVCPWAYTGVWLDLWSTSCMSRIWKVVGQRKWSKCRTTNRDGCWEHFYLPETKGQTQRLLHSLPYETGGKCDLSCPLCLWFLFYVISLASCLNCMAMFLGFHRMSSGHVSIYFLFFILSQCLCEVSMRLMYALVSPRYAIIQKCTVFIKEKVNNLFSCRCWLQQAADLQVNFCSILLLKLIWMASRLFNMTLPAYVLGQFWKNRTVCT